MTKERKIIIGGLIVCLLILIFILTLPKAEQVSASVPAKVKTETVSFISTGTPNYDDIFEGPAGKNCIKVMSEQYYKEGIDTRKELKSSGISGPVYDKILNRIKAKEEKARRLAAARSGASFNITPADLSVSQQEIVAEWAPRIDRYLAGSPLAGQGKTFAMAAAINKVDPRISPAIACIESGKGANCFRSYNAWGWGKQGFSSWAQAINTHVAGFKRGYGSTLDMGDANKYCPPTASEWYRKVSSQMSKI